MSRTAKEHDVTTLHDHLLTEVLRWQGLLVARRETHRYRQSAASLQNVRRAVSELKKWRIWLRAVAPTLQDAG